VSSVPFRFVAMRFIYAITGSLHPYLDVVDLVDGERIRSAAGLSGGVLAVCRALVVAELHVVREALGAEALFVSGGREGRGGGGTVSRQPRS